MSKNIDSDLIKSSKELRLHYLHENLESFIAGNEKKDLREALDQLIRLELVEKKQRSIQVRMTSARLGWFHRMANFEWNWPAEIDRDRVESLLNLDFLSEKSNVVLAGAQGLGKTMISKNVGVNAVNRGYKVLFTTASKLVTDLLSSGHALEASLRRYEKPDVLIIDEVGYLSFELKAADLLFEVISRRYQQKPIILTTNLAFKDWPEIFPGASCVTALVDRLTHNAEIIKISGDSYRQNESKQKNKRRAK